MIDNSQIALGKTLGRLGCGGVQHFDPAHRDWGAPRMLEISIGDEKILSLPVVGFDVQRQQVGVADTRLAFLAVEP